MDNEARIKNLEKKSRLFQSLLCILAIAFFALALSRCGLFDGGGSSATAQSTSDTISAANVTIDVSNNRLDSTNLQDAIDNEIGVDLVQKIIGTWDIENFTNDPNHGPTGRVTILDDGTFDLVTGFFAAIGEGDGSLGLCDHVENSQVYAVLAGQVIQFTHGIHSLIPTLMEANEDSLIFLGSGGCGQLGTQRLSRLTRVQ